MKEKEFDHIVKQKLESITDAPPAYMWDKIATNIPVATTGGGIATSIKVALVAATVAIVGSLSFLLMQDKPVKRVAIENSSFPNTEFVVKKHQQQKNSEETISTSIVNSNDENKTTETTSATTSASIKQQVNYTNKKQTRKVENAKNTSNQEQDFNNIARTKVRLVNDNNQQKMVEKSTDKEVKKQAVDYKLATVPVIAPKVETAIEPTEVTPLNKTNSELTPIAIEEEQEIAQEEEVVEQPEVAVEENTETEYSPVNTSVETVPKEEGSTVQENPKNRQLNKYGIGFHYGPEFIRVDDIKLTDQGFDFSFNYQNLNFIVQTGLGIRFSEEKLAYDMQYNRWEYLETQIRFDSLEVKTDQNGNPVFDQYGKPVLVPINPYYVEIYDSASHSYHATATEQSVILQIPLLLGYQVDYKKFAYFIKGGIRYSLITHTNTKGLYEIDDQSKLVHLDYPYKVRAKSNIDYELSLGGIYKLNENFQIHAEALGRYYHYSMYEENPPSGIHPWSLSGRVGLVYILR